MHLKAGATHGRERSVALSFFYLPGFAPSYLICLRIYVEAGATHGNRVAFSVLLLFSLLSNLCEDITEEGATA